MITVIKTINGDFNVFGTDGGMFVIQGNLTEAQLRELVAAAHEALGIREALREIVDALDAELSLGGRVPVHPDKYRGLIA